jgi:hypothetical protein
MEPTLFVRERRKVEKGEKKPRFRVIGVSQKELDQLAEATGVKVVVLKAGKEQKGQQ